VLDIHERATRQDIKYEHEYDEHTYTGTVYTTILLIQHNT
jgi:hypothetical protein